MGLAIANVTTLFSKDMLSNIEFKLMDINNQLLSLSRQSQEVLQNQARAGQIYMEQHKDEEGQVDASAIEWVNSAAFTRTFEAKLATIQTKEQALSMQKIMYESKHKGLTANHDSWKKQIDAGVKCLNWAK